GPDRLPHRPHGRAATGARDRRAARAADPLRRRRRRPRRQQALPRRRRPPRRPTPAGGGARGRPGPAAARRPRPPAAPPRWGHRRCRRRGRGRRAARRRRLSGRVEDGLVREEMTPAATSGPESTCGQGAALAEAEARGHAAGGALRLGSARGRWVLLMTILGSGMAGIDATIVGVALPAIGRTFQAPFTTLQWVVTGYALTLAAFILLGGVLGDRYGRRRIFVVGVVWFALASLACGLAPTAGTLVLARALQGIGGAL